MEHLGPARRASHPAFLGRALAAVLLLVAPLVPGGTARAAPTRLAGWLERLDGVPIGGAAIGAGATPSTYYLVSLDVLAGAGAREREVRGLLASRNPTARAMGFLALTTRTRSRSARQRLTAGVCDTAVVLSFPGGCGGEWTTVGEYVRELLLDPANTQFDADEALSLVVGSHASPECATPRAYLTQHALAAAGVAPTWAAWTQRFPDVAPAPRMITFGRVYEGQQGTTADLRQHLRDADLGAPTDLTAASILAHFDDEAGLDLLRAAHAGAEGARRGELASVIQDYEARLRFEAAMAALGLDRTWATLERRADEVIRVLRTAPVQSVDVVAQYTRMHAGDRTDDVHGAAQAVAAALRERAAGLPAWHYEADAHRQHVVLEREAPVAARRRYPRR